MLVVRRVDNVIHWINGYPLDSAVGPRRFTVVDRDSNVFRFCNSLIFTGMGYQPPEPNPQPGGPEGSHFVWPLPFDLFGMGDLPGV